MAAGMLGVSGRRVAQIVRDGEGPPQSADGRFPPAEFGVWFRARVKRELGISDDGEAYDFQAERGRLTKYQADKTKLETEELRGDLIRSADVDEAWSAKAIEWRAKLLPFPSKIAQRIAPPERIAEVQAAAQAVVYEILNDIAGFDGLPDRARARRAAGGRDVAPAAESDGQPVGGRKPKAVAGVKRRAREVGDGDR